MKKVRILYKTPDLQALAASPTQRRLYPISHKRWSITLSTSCTTPQRHSSDVIDPTPFHLFNYVCFTDDLSKWKEKFPDPASLSAKYTRTLSYHRRIVRDEDVKWIKSFTNVVRLEVLLSCCGRSTNMGGQVVAFCNFPLAHEVNSLTPGWGIFSSQEVFSFLCSLPHVEDLRFTKGLSIDNEDFNLRPCPCLPQLLSTGPFQKVFL